jgi:hypothetical protein
MKQSPPLHHQNITVSNSYQRSFFSPAVVFSILLIVIVALSFLPNQKVQQFLQGFDRIFFFTIGLLGVLLVFMWTATDHLMTKNNFNLLWAWPTHALIAFFATAKKTWVKKYFIITTIGIILVLCSWLFLPQQMNNALLPLLLLMLYRSYARQRSI